MVVVVVIAGLVLVLEGRLVVVVGRRCVVGMEVVVPGLGAPPAPMTAPWMAAVRGGCHRRQRRHARWKHNASSSSRQPHRRLRAAVEVEVA